MVDLIGLAAVVLTLGLLAGLWIGEIVGRRHPRPTRLDLDMIEREQLVQCGPCDYGLIEIGCQCAGDPRPVIAQLVHEVRRLSGVSDRG